MCICIYKDPIHVYSSTVCIHMYKYIIYVYTVWRVIYELPSKSSVDAWYLISSGFTDSDLEAGNGRPRLLCLCVCNHVGELSEYISRLF